MPLWQNLMAEVESLTPNQIKAKPAFFPAFPISLSQG